MKIRPGKRVVPLEIGEVASLTEDDVRMLQVPGSRAAPSVKRLAERHHRLAQMLAAGTRPGVAAAAVGLEPSRVSVLQTDPAFKDLVELYRANSESEFAEIASQLNGLTKDAIVTLRDRLDEDDEQFTNGELMKLAELGADRSGHGPSSTQEHNINIGLGERLKNARERALAAARGELDVIEGDYSVA